MGKEDYEEKAAHYDNAEKADRALDELEEIDEGIIDDGEVQANLEEAKAVVL